MELKDTIEFMTSDNYEERFVAEYWQLKIRYEKLHKMIVRYTANTLDFELNCSIELLQHQKSLMGQLLFDLEVRAEIEHIDLESINYTKFNGVSI